MGYTTEFTGQVTIEPPLNPEELKFFTQFQRSLKLYSGETKPSDWFEWISEDGKTIKWSGGEKFYYAPEWMEYLILHFFGDNPLAKLNDPERFSFMQSHTLNGTLNAQGEEEDDQWQLIVKNNVVTVESDETYDPEDY